MNTAHLELEYSQRLGQLKLFTSLIICYILIDKDYKQNLPNLSKRNSCVK